MNMRNSNLLLAVEEILEGRLRSVPSATTFNERDRAFLRRLIDLSNAGDMTITRKWIEDERSKEGPQWDTNRPIAVL